METSSNSVRSLSALSADILDLILSYDEVTHLVVRLWKVGDQSLNAKLAMSISRVALNDGYGFSTRLPSVLSHLRGLTHFTLQSKRSFFAQPSDWYSALRALPKSLTHLEITSYDSELAFLNYATDSASTTYERGESDCVDVGALFPQLRTLKMLHAPSSLLPALPSSLTAFSCEFSDVGSPSFEKLPRSLQYLEADYVLDINEPDTDEDGEESYPGLNALTLAPPGMELSSMHVSVWAEEQSWASRLPEGLRSLAFTERVTLSPPMISQFPRSLTRLDCSELSGNLFAAAGHDIWPPNLRSLEMVIGELRPGYLAALPRTLFELTLYFNAITDSEERSAIFASELPPRLQRLTLHLDAPSIVKGTLPATLKVLWWIELPQCPMETWSAIPSSITQLEISYINPAVFDARGGSLPNLKHLGLQTCGEGEFVMVPRTVTKLTVYILNGSEDPKNKATFQDLPDTLISLEVSTCRRHFAYETLNRLHQLEELRLPRSTKIPCSLLGHLPQTLKTLHMEIVNPESFDLTKFPPNLTYCDLGRQEAMLSRYEEVCPFMVLPQVASKWTGEQIERLRKRHRDLDL